MIRDVLVLIPTCTAFSDTWAPGIACMRKFWPDCPHDRMWLIAGEINPTPQLWPGRENNLLFGSRTMPDHGWCQVLNSYLSPKDWGGQVPFVLMFLDDMFLCAPPDRERLAEAVQLMRDHSDIAAIQLYHRDDASELYGSSSFFRLRVNAPYRITTGPCLWRTTALRELTAEGGTAWNFELQGNVRETGWMTILSCGRQSVISVQYTAVTRGEFEPGALEFLRREGIAVDTTRRPIRGQ